MKRQKIRVDVNGKLKRSKAVDNIAMCKSQTGRNCNCFRTNEVHNANFAPEFAVVVF